MKKFCGSLELHDRATVADIGGILDKHTGLAKGPTFLGSCAPVTEVSNMTM
jgi:hypothetical protein